ncbi:hypothetical protein Poli38472_009713 [Pythium oligandrum]|uniref:EF-hand domain-containing protein n=1 Tax=Pythium oligandrum TaxID=41045 RepID=A0A8K1FFZ7_PYTOL|nr:hypothetical protein Poli38472_009713 [Pythium oligandrum]|eukprot:TMW62220.1 hypothetical protein Poli38472_009713 [Pythium oligandrum]
MVSPGKDRFQSFDAFSNEPSPEREQEIKTAARRGNRSEKKYSLADSDDKKRLQRLTERVRQSLAPFYLARGGVNPSVANVPAAATIRTFVESLQSSRAVDVGEFRKCLYALGVSPGDSALILDSVDRRRSSIIDMKTFAVTFLPQYDNNSPLERPERVVKQPARREDDRSIKDFHQKVIERVLVRYPSVKDAFRQYDSKRSGLLSIGQFRAFMRDLGFVGTQVDALIRYLDRNNQLCVSFNAFSSGMKMSVDQSYVKNSPKKKAVEPLVHKNGDHSSNGQKGDPVEAIRAKLRQRVMGKSKTIREIFMDFDADGNGYLDYAEFKRFMAEYSFTAAEANIAIEFLDQDYSGTIDYDEFAAGLLFYRPSILIKDRVDTYERRMIHGQNVLSMVRDKLALTMKRRNSTNVLEFESEFEKFDVDGNKRLDYQEFNAFLIGIGVKLSDEDFAALVQILDTDRSRHIEFDEFTALFRNLNTAPDNASPDEEDDEEEEDDDGDTTGQSELHPQQQSESASSQKLRRIFDKYDVDGSGELDPAEFRRLMRNLGYNDTEIRKHLKTAKGEGSGIDFETLSSILATSPAGREPPVGKANGNASPDFRRITLPPPSPKLLWIKRVLHDHPSLKEAFREHDTDNSGELDHNEFKRFMKHYGMQDDHEIDQLIRKLDTDGDGSISCDEFTRFFQRVLQSNPRPTEQPHPTPLKRVPGEEESEAIPADQLGVLRELELQWVTNALAHYDSVEAAFRAHDRNNQRELDYEQFRNLMGEFGITDDSNVRLLLRRLDKDNSKTVSLDEFLTVFNGPVGVKKNIKPITKSPIKAAVRSQTKLKPNALLAQMGKANAARLHLLEETWVKNVLEQHSSIREAFEVYDVDRSGELDHNEFKNLMRAFGIEKDDDISSLIQRLDLDNSGTIDFDEFATIFHERRVKGQPGRPPKQRIEHERRRQSVEATKPNGAARLRELEIKWMKRVLSCHPSIQAAFREYDKDGNGDLDHEEFARFMKRYGITRDEDIARLIRRLDLNNSGTVDFDEFSAVFNPVLCDRYDNVITTKADEVATDELETVLEIERELAERIMKGTRDLRLAFRKFDLNGNGRLEYKEFRTVLKAYKFPEMEIRKVIRHLDHTVSGYIDYKQFVASFSMFTEGEGRKAKYQVVRKTKPKRTNTRASKQGRGFYLDESALLVLVGIDLLEYFDKKLFALSSALDPPPVVVCHRLGVRLALDCATDGEEAALSGQAARMATVNLIHRHIFGLKADVSNNVAYVDEQTVTYPAGHNLIVYSLDEKRQKFISGTENTLGITAMAIATNRRFVAVAERSDRGLVSIYDLKTLKKRKVLSNAETQGQVYVTMEFSADGQLLLTQGGAPDWILTCWNWSKGKAVASIKSPLHVTLHASPSAAMLGHQFGSVSGLSMAGLMPSGPLGVSNGVSTHAGLGAGNVAANNDPNNANGNTAMTQVVTACSFSNVDPGLVCVTGVNLVRYFRVLENVFRPMPSPRMESHVFLCHVWMKQRDDYMIAGTAEGDMMLFHGGEFVTRLLGSPGEGKSIHSMLSTSKGILCGLDDATVYMYAVNSETNSNADKNASDLLILQRKLKVDSFPAIIHTLCVSPNEDNVIVSLSSGQLLTFPYQHQNGHGFSSTVGSALTSMGAAAAVSVASPSTSGIMDDGSALSVSKHDEIEYVLTSFHRPSETTGQMHVTGMDVCVRKPILVTCGLDKTVRVWNYLERSCEVAKQFTEEAHSVACHPSGLYLLVGFADKLRLMNILMDDIRPFKEFAVKACRECQFSTGGHLFAAVNGNTIQVFNFLTCELIANLRGHNGKVRCLYWNQDDSSVISAGMDGAVYQWDLDEAKRDAEFVQKGVPYYSTLCNREGTAIYAVGSDRMLKEIEFPSSQLTKEFICESVLGQIVLSTSQRMLFGATAESERPGAVRSFKFPLTGESIEFQCLSAPVTRLCISYDDGFLFAAGEDGAVCIFEIRDKEGRPRMKEGTASSGTSSRSGTVTTAGSNGSDFHHWSHFSEEILVTKSDLEEKNALMLELKNKVDELMLHNEYQLRLKDMTYNENLKELTEKFTHEIEGEKNKYELLREDKNDIEMEYEEKIKQMEEKHLQQMQEVEAEYQHRIMREVEKYQDVLQQREAQAQHWKLERERLVHTHEKYVTDVTEDFEQRLNEDRQLRLQMEDEKEELGREYTETITQVEADVDEEIENLKKRYEEKLQAEREATLRFKGENGIMKKKFSALQKDIEDQRDQIKSLLEKEKDLIEEIKTLEKEIQALKREIRARDETIGEKEKRIYDLKRKNQELEKFKFVLDYKIKELKRQIEPRENEIADMKEQIKEMDRELELFHKSNAQLDLMIGEQRKRINTMQDEITKYRKLLGDQQTWVRRFRCDLYECVQYIQNPKELALQVASLYKKYVTNDQPSQEIEVEIQHEYARQKEYLEKSVQVLKKKYTRDVALHQEETMRATAENMMLIKEINELRGALNTSKATLQMERAAIGAREARDLASAAHRASSFDNKDPDTLIDQQRQEIDDLRRAIKALEDKMTQPKPSSEGTIFPPIRGVDG